MPGGKGSAGSGRRVSGADGPPSSHRRRTPQPVHLSSGRILPIGERALLMGVVNVTPDSFHPGSRTPSPDDAVARALELLAAGADIIDVGGESTRPGSEPVSESEEIDRVLPVIETLCKTTSAVVSVDTTKAAVARAAITAGAEIVNDVSAMAADPAMLPLVAATGVIAVMMHMRGKPRTMQEQALYDDVVLEVKAELGARIGIAVHAGIAHERIWIDPGLGFAKTARNTLEIIRRLEEFTVFEKPILIGASRKSFIGRVLDAPDTAGRLEGSLAVAAVAALKGAHVIRTHDVRETLRTVRTVEAILNPERF